MQGGTDSLELCRDKGGEITVALVIRRWHYKDAPPPGGIDDRTCAAAAQSTVGCAAVA